MTTDPDQQREFLHALHVQVDEEAEAQRLALNQLYRLPLEQRVVKGRAIERVRVVRGEAEKVMLRFPYNGSVFREGDLLQIGRGDPLMDPRFQVSIEREFDGGFECAMFSCQLELDAEDPDGWVIEESAMDLSDWYRRALEAAGETTIGRERILPLLMGESQPVIDPQRYERATKLAEQAGFNWSQQQALAEAYASDSAYLIQGPPGTGKTRVLAQLADQLARDGERVFVTSFTHRAINNALNTIASHHPGAMAIKIGRAAAADDLRVANYEDFASCPFRKSGSGYLIGATCFAAQTNRLRDVQFDTVIFDEASQITLPLAIMGMLSAKRYIFVGDQKQLPPVMASRGGLTRPEDSVFGHLAGRGFETMLDTSYRLSAALCAWPSKTFYQGALVPAKPGELADAVQFVPVEHEGCSVHAPAEVERVVQLVEQMVADGIPAREIGVVAPFRVQGRAIRRALVKKNAEYAAIVADTVERMQGQERDVIIFSLVSSDAGFMANIAGFYFQPERLNVSITRARKRLYVVGSLASLLLEPDEEPLRSWHGLFVGYLRALQG